MHVMNLIHSFPIIVQKPAVVLLVELGKQLANRTDNVHSMVVVGGGPAKVVSNIKMYVLPLLLVRTPLPERGTPFLEYRAWLKRRPYAFCCR